MRVIKHGGKITSTASLIEEVLQVISNRLEDDCACDYCWYDDEPNCPQREYRDIYDDKPNIDVAKTCVEGLVICAFKAFPEMEEEKHG